jgi:hippurate hydrolase
MSKHAVPQIETLALEHARDLTAFRRDLHRHPELGFAEHRTANRIAARLTAAGFSVTQGLAGTGLVATLRRGTGGRRIGLRADMDALPLQEATGAPHASTASGVMHACGHDGHVATLVGAAESLARRGRLSGTLHRIFQPAEEGLAGARRMMDDGLFDRFPCDAIFALPNEPSLPLGTIAVRPGPIMAASDRCDIAIHGRGGHGADPQETADPVVCGSAIVLALQTIVSRNIHPMEPAVVTVGSFHAGTAANIVPERADLGLTIRSFEPGARDLLERRIAEIAKLQAASFGLTAEVTYRRGYGPTRNDPDCTAFIRGVALDLVGPSGLIDLTRPIMGAEDFSFMLAERPGSFVFLGTGRTASDPPLHSPAFDFNDAALPVGAALWVKTAETFLCEP